jgi:hypothetical protein
MSKSINILDKDYLQWVKELCMRYRNSQIKAAVKVNQSNLPQLVEDFYAESFAIPGEILRRHFRDASLLPILQQLAAILVSYQRAI